MLRMKSETGAGKKQEGMRERARDDGVTMQ
jgi:hypothetical protein